MWQQRFNLGTYFRIGVHVHWSFALLIAYIGYAGYQDGLPGTLFGISVLIGMFFCVTLHEYGHALMARQFGIETMDITLFPIGGVARLMKIPRVPWQEFLVAVAGPAVNVVILTVLMTVWLFLPDALLPSPLSIFFNEVSEARFVEIANSISWQGYMVSMVGVNTILILFNMIPAFPMDGGRVLRSVLAMALEYRLATRIASNIGIFCAILMGLVAIYFQAVPAGLVAIFICYAGISEARHVDVVEPLRGHRVEEAMITDPPSIAMSSTAAEAIEFFRSCPLKAVPIVDEADYTVGMLLLSDVIKRRNEVDAATGKQAAIETSFDSEVLESGVCHLLATIPCTQWARHDIPILSPGASLETIVTSLPPQFRQFPVTDPHGRLVGLLDLDSLGDRLGLFA
ncbi:site-2 protease family protein [Roseiconus lacunae]|uniref:Site-2 protease family protein n=1 Tax=Roseiconus lacunae TaxID=2605694 RepID=A0ABT7PF22_9BACT|nr:site-2 protease family protein [Roseiconus lacunae]MDM4014899.1 site-2 protease family protein [Roseiconus lacunae]